MVITSIVLSWNRRDDTLTCLQSLHEARAAGVRHDVIVVDNGSADGSADAVERRFPDAELVRLPENVGFAAGANRGIGVALERGSRWTLLVNNDATVSPSILSDLLGAATDERIGMLTPTIYFADRPNEVWPSAGWRRRLTLAPFDTTAHPPSLEPYDVSWATGCCLLVRDRLWREVGVFDERYRFYYEDHDLCIRAVSAGWRILHVPGASAWHKVAGSTGTGSRAQLYLLGRGSVPYYMTHATGMHRLLIVPYRLASAVRTVVASCADGRPQAGAAYVRGLYDGARDLTSSARRRGDGSPTASSSS